MKSIYVTIEGHPHGYEPTVYNLKDLKAYCKSEGIDPKRLIPRHDSSVRNRDLWLEVCRWINSHKTAIIHKPIERWATKMFMGGYTYTPIYSCDKYVVVDAETKEELSPDYNSYAGAADFAERRGLKVDRQWKKYYH